MQLEKPSALRRKEIYRYLACPENSPAADDLLDRCEADLLAAAQPRGVWRILPREQRGTLPAIWRAAAGWC